MKIFRIINSLLNNAIEPFRFELTIFIIGLAFPYKTIFYVILSDEQKYNFKYQHDIEKYRFL